jgi:hypothetical protein
MPCQGHLWVHSSTAVLPRRFLDTGKASIARTSELRQPPSIFQRPEEGDDLSSLCLSLVYDQRARLNNGSHMSV